VKDKQEVKNEKPIANGKSNNNGLDIQFVSNLKRHNKSVNVVRWSNDGQVLASAGDEAVIFLWQENDIKNQKTLDNDDCENKENWFVFKTFRGHLEDILDLAWSKDGSVLISGSIDNSVYVWNVSTGAKLALLKEPKGFVQGVVYDPLGSVYGVISTDRCLRIYSTGSNKCIHNVNKIQLNKENKENAEVTGSFIKHFFLFS
jgi:chromatin assembly factor 1 subunit B